MNFIKRYLVENEIDMYARKSIAFQFVLVIIVFDAVQLFGFNPSGNKLNWTKLLNDIRKSYPMVKQITTQELDEWLKSADRKKPLLLDARAKDEYAASHLKDAKLASTEKKALKILDTMQRDEPIVVYCSVGVRSSKLAQKLQKQGYFNVYNLEGSIFKWANEGRPVYADEKVVKKVHHYDSKWGQFLKRKLWDENL